MILIAMVGFIRGREVLLGGGMILFEFEHFLFCGIILVIAVGNLYVDYSAKSRDEKSHTSAC